MVERPRIGGGMRETGGTVVHFRTETVPEGVVLRVEGEVDLLTAPQLEEAIAGAYQTRRCVIVDLSRLDYLDGSGIRVLMRAAEENTGRFVVIGSKPTIRRLFEILRLVDILPVVATLGAAREYLGVQ